MVRVFQTVQRACSRRPSHHVNAQIHVSPRTGEPGTNWSLHHTGVIPCINTNTHWVLLHSSVERSHIFHRFVMTVKADTFWIAKLAVSQRFGTVQRWPGVCELTVLTSLYHRNLQHSSVSSFSSAVLCQCVNFEHQKSTLMLWPHKLVCCDSGCWQWHRWNLQGTVFVRSTAGWHNTCSIRSWCC